MMEDFLPVINYVERHIALTDEEKAYFCSLLRIIRVKKKQLIVQPDFVCKYKSYVVKGVLRSYLVGNEGQEHTISLAIEDWWIADYHSYINQLPATLFVEALEEGILIQIDYNAEQLLMETYPKFERFFRIIAQRSLASTQHRMLSNLSKSAEQRLEEFEQKYPKIVNRVPQYILASYLGFSSEFLSKIRNNRAKKS
jgi:CRP-like cAMP-binding protein